MLNSKIQMQWWYTPITSELGRLEAGWKNRAPSVGAHTFIPAFIWEAETNLHEFEATLAYRVPGQPRLQTETLSQNETK